MRGKDTQSPQRVYYTRITPAYAGKSSFIFPPKIFNKDHPRLCGEKVCSSNDDVQASRITPAYAGKRELAGIVFSEN